MYSVQSAFSVSHLEFVVDLGLQTCPSTRNRAVASQIWPVALPVRETVLLTPTESDQQVSSRTQLLTAESLPKMLYKRETIVCRTRFLPSFSPWICCLLNDQQSYSVDAIVHQPCMGDENGRIVAWKEICPSQDITNQVNHYTLCIRWMTVKHAIFLAITTCTAQITCNLIFLPAALSACTNLLQHTPIRWVICLVRSLSLEVKDGIACF